VYSQESAPEGFSLIDPDHLTGAQATSLYNHWLERQRKGLEPFIIINAGPLHAMPSQKPSNGKGRKKEKPQYLDVTTDEESVGDSSAENDCDAKTADVDAEEEEEEVDAEEEAPAVVKYGPPISAKKSQLGKGFSGAKGRTAPTGPKLRSRRKKGDGENIDDFEQPALEPKGRSSNATPGPSKKTNQKGKPPKQPKGAVTPARRKPTAITGAVSFSTAKYFF
jgi:hypothetical protein